VNQTLRAAFKLSELVRSKARSSDKHRPLPATFRTRFGRPGRTHRQARQHEPFDFELEPTGLTSAPVPRREPVGRTGVPRTPALTR
jgi:hypothetical protein